LAVVNDSSEIWLFPSAATYLILGTAKDVVPFPGRFPFMLGD
jgi:hypothetical protein